MTDVAPWWAIPSITGLFAIGGVLIGQGVLIRNERWKARKEDSVRWHQTRLELYLRYMETAGRVRDEISAYIKSGSWAKPFELKSTSLPELERLDKHIRLISTRPVYDASLDLATALLAYFIDTERRFAKWLDSLNDEQINVLLEGEEWPDTYPQPPSIEEFDRNDESAQAASIKLSDQIRKELRVPGITAPKSSLKNHEFRREIREATRQLEEAEAKLEKLRVNFASHATERGDQAKST